MSKYPQIRRKLNYYPEFSLKSLADWGLGKVFSCKTAYPYRIYVIHTHTHTMIYPYVSLYICNFSVTSANRTSRIPTFLLLVLTKMGN